MKFIFEEDVKVLGVRGVYLRIKGLHNHVEDVDSLAKFINSSTEVVKESLSHISIDEDPILRGFFELHNRVGANNRKLVASPQNLLRLTQEKGALPRINPVVDIYNLLSIKTHLALGAHDCASIDGDVTLKLTDGSEQFWPLGSNKAEKVKKGEYAYVDNANDVLCRLEVRQVEKTKVTERTTDCFYIIQGNKETDINYIRNTARDLVNITKLYCGGIEEYLYTW